MNNINKAIDLITTNSLLKIVSSLKFIELPTLKNGRVKQFVSPDGNYSVLIPKDKDFLDYRLVMAENIKQIAEYDNSSIESLLNRLLNPSYDILKWRISDNSTFFGKIQLIRMQDIIDNIKEILSVSYLDVKNPSKFHDKIKTKEVEENIKGYSFGQTEIGSYILNVLCPLGEYQCEMFQPDSTNIPIYREINIKLLSSISNIQNDLDSNNVNKVEEEVDKGTYSADFLETLADIYDNTKDSEMNIYADWCENVKLMPNFNLNHVKLEPQHIQRVMDIADKYKSSPEINTKKNFFGRIYNITANPDIKNREYVEIKIATLDGDLRKINVMSRLPYESYQMVLDAFEHGKNIKLSGIYNSKGRQRWIDEGTIQSMDD